MDEPLCELSGPNIGDSCWRCGYEMKVNAQSIPRRKCGGPLVLGWGDRASRLLAKTGIHKRRYLAIKGWLGFLPECGCQKRREQMNTFGRAVGRTIGKVLIRIKTILVWLLRAPFARHEDMQ